MLYPPPRIPSVLKQIRIRERGKDRAAGGNGISSQNAVHFFGITFSQANVCLTMNKFIKIALVVLKIFKLVKPTTFSMKFDTKQA